MKKSPLRPTLLLSLLLGVVSCANLQNSTKNMSTLYDYQIQNSQGQPLDLSKLTKDFIQADVILVGEWHSHPAIHLFQTQLFANLDKTLQNKGTKLALSMEQFSRSEQEILDSYLQNKMGEQAFITKAKAWPNYQSDYRPLVEYAKDNKLNVIAANTSREMTRCLAKQGRSYFDNLDSKKKNLIAKQLNTEDSAYKEKFLKLSSHGENAMDENHYLAQVAWDETMAESIVNYLRIHPNEKIMHIAGSFHIENGLGIADRIHALNSKLKIVIISPISPDQETSIKSTDYKLLVNPLPKQWLNQKEMHEAFSKMKLTKNSTKDNNC